jgi:antirestriction protein ArdC
MNRNLSSRKKMTATEACQFDTYSPKNAAIIQSQLVCDCVPYETVLTYGRWQAIGFQVQKGQHGITIVAVKDGAKTDPDTGEEVIVKYAKKTHVFCKCQVKKIEEQVA